MQVMTFWKNVLDPSNVNLTYTATNLRCGCNILRFYLDRKDQHLSPLWPLTTAKTEVDVTPQIPRRVVDTVAHPTD